MTDRVPIFDPTQYHSEPGKGWYNGFSPKQRAASSAPQRRAKVQGIRPAPLVCSITDHVNEPDRIQVPLITHLETYASDRFLDWYPCTHAVHSALHARFYRPRAWYAVVYKNYRHGAWYSLLTLNPDSRIISYDGLYPNGLPGADELWPEAADALGLHRELFNPTNPHLWGLWLPSAGLQRIT